MHTTITNASFTCFKTHEEAQIVANTLGTDDPDWTYTVEENLFGFYVAIYEGADRLGTI